LHSSPLSLFRSYFLKLLLSPSRSVYLFPLLSLLFAN
jgi:hypothetical protein